MINTIPTIFPAIHQTSDKRRIPQRDITIPGGLFMVIVEISWPQHSLKAVTTHL